MEKTAHKKGFTLIELLIVIAIVGVLAAVVLIAINPAKRLAQARDSGRKNDVGQMAVASQAFFTTTGRYPSDVAELTTSEDLKTAPTAPSGGVCTGTAGAYSFDLLSSSTDLIISVCLESPTTTGYVAGNYWAWCTSTGKATEYASKPTSTGTC